MTVTAYVYGKLAPNPVETHPRVQLSKHLTLTEPPLVVDYASRVSTWPMYLNDRIGDCTCAALGHALQAWTEYAKGTMVTLPDGDVLSLYEAVSGYDPTTGANDNGAVEQNVLKYVQENGIGGHKIRAFAQVDHKNLSEMKAALYHFGTVYVGFQVPQSAEVQHGAGQPWTVVPNSPIMGGHAIDIQKWDADYMYAVTWGGIQAMDEKFWLTYGDEAWVIITDDWLNEKGLSPEGLNIVELLKEFDEIAGTVTPVKKSCWFGSAVKKLFKK